MSDEIVLDKTSCLYLARKYVRQRGWQLIPEAEIAEAVWRMLEGRQFPSERKLRQAVERATRQQYGAVLYPICQEQADARHEVAWEEVRSWLTGIVNYLVDGAQDQEDRLQDAVLKLYERLSECRSPLNFLAFASQVARHEIVDWWRQQGAEMRSGKAVIKELDNDLEQMAQVSDKGLSPEQIGADVVARERLQQFFAMHFAPLEQSVLTAILVYNVDKAVKIAELIGIGREKSYRVRQALARIRTRLQSLPPESVAELRDILNNLADRGGALWGN